MKRRSFVKNASLMALSVSAFGLVRWDGKTFVGDSPTTTDILGPFYRPGAPMRANLIPAGSGGIPLHLKGVIFKHDGKAPLQDALVEIWQCDEKEYYDNISDDYLFRGALKTGADGSYHFKTIVPVPYKANPDNEASWRPAHIHMRVSSSQQQDLVTQIYLKGDPYLKKDRSASAPQAVNRILAVQKNGASENEIIFNVVMRKDIPLDAAVYAKITGLYRTDKNLIEFYQADDMLMMKLNGQLLHSLHYVDHNRFEAGIGFPKVQFELTAGGGAKAMITTRNNTYSGEKFLKY